jgi:hypothetical protein
MKKDIIVPKVSNIAIAAIPEDENIEKSSVWNIYLINLKEETISNVMITSKGYGEDNGEKVKTSTLRWFYDEIESKEYIKIEPILKQLLHLSHEFWVSFQWNGSLLDRKFVFVSSSLNENNFVQIPILNTKGVMII